MAWVVARYCAYADYLDDPEGEHELEKKIWQRVAFASRYGGATLTEILHLDGHYLALFSNAIGELVKQENTPAKASGR